MPGVSGIARQIVCPRPDATFPSLVDCGFVIAHGAAADGTPREFLEQIREFLAFAAALAFFAEERHVLDTVEECLVNNGGIVPRDDFLSPGSFFSLEFSDVFTDNRPIAQELVDVALVPNRLPRVPCRDAFLSQRPNNDPAPVALHVHVEDTTDELRSVFEHMKLAVTHLEPPRTLARRDDAVFRQLALCLPVFKGSERLVLTLAV